MMLKSEIKKIVKETASFSLRSSEDDVEVPMKEFQKFLHRGFSLRSSEDDVEALAIVA